MGRKKQEEEQNNSEYGKTVSEYSESLSQEDPLLWNMSSVQKFFSVTIYNQYMNHMLTIFCDTEGRLYNMIES